jgi:hypothetical protein
VGNEEDISESTRCSTLSVTNEETFATGKELDTSLKT